MPNSPNNALQTRIPPASRHAMHGVVLRGVRLSGTGKYAAGINNDIPRQTLQLVFIDKPISFQMFRSNRRMDNIHEQRTVRLDKMDRTEEIEKFLHKRIAHFSPPSMQPATPYLQHKSGNRMAGRRNQAGIFLALQKNSA